MNNEATAELEELPEHQRAQVQLSQAENLGMQGHIFSKLRMARKKLAATLNQAAPTAEDDMQILARDISFAEPTSTTSQPASPPASPKTKWLAAAAIALGLGTPATVGIVMAPRIIAALHQPSNQPLNQPVSSPLPPAPNYVPILLPGKPQGTR